MGTASRWLVPALVDAPPRARAGCRLRVNEGTSERLFAEVLEGELAQAVVTEPVTDRRLEVERLLDEALVADHQRRCDSRGSRCHSTALAAYPLVLPPERNPLRIELETMAEAQGVTLRVPVEVEGIRLIGDLVASGDLRVDPSGDHDPADRRERQDRHHRQDAATPARTDPRP